MLSERLFENLALDVEPFALCDVAPGWRLRMDGLDWVTLHYVLHGMGRLLAGPAGAHDLGPWNLALVPPQLEHAIESGETVLSEVSTREVGHEVQGLLEFHAGPESGSDLLVACGRVQATLAGGLGLFAMMREAIVLDFADSKRMRETFAGLLEEQRTLAPGCRTMMTALMRECLVLVFRRLSTDPKCELPWLSALEDPHLAPAIDAILEEPDRPHSVDSLAAYAYMSRAAFSRRFTAMLGRTPMAFVRDVRLRQSAKLLRSTDLSVDTVARRVGFSSRSHFTRAFQQYFGESPARFRTEASVEAA